MQNTTSNNVYNKNAFISETASVTSALGTLIGYLGAEAATVDFFERLLWPQRFYTGVTLKNSLCIGLGIPMGGPLHQAALHTLDKCYRNGLFKGQRLGNMLGTAFFHDMGLKYTVHNYPLKQERESVRNGLWVRVVSEMPLPNVPQGNGHVENGANLRKPIRAKTSVNLLQLSFVNEVPESNRIVRNDTGPVTFQCLASIVWSEITGIGTAAVVAVIWQSWFSCLWLLPLLLKMVSLLFVIPREGLVKKPKRLVSKEKPMASVEPNNIKRFEIKSKGHGFLVVEGDESVVLQFFRHYGHPVRHRLREIIQIAIIAAFGSVFLLGLMLSILCMPGQLQYVWLGYQLYATLAMIVYRYCKGHEWGTVEEKLAAILEDQKNGESVVYLQDKSGDTVMARLSRTYADSFGEGREAMMKLLEVEKLGETYSQTPRLLTGDSSGSTSSEETVECRQESQRLSKVEN